MTNWELLIFQLIKSLYSKNKTCFANNRRFVENSWYKNKETVSKIISALCKKWIIEIEYKEEKRYLIPLDKGVDLEVNGVDLEVNGVDLEVNGGWLGSQGGVDLEVKGGWLGSHTYNNILYNIINYYNKKLNFSFFEKVESFNKYGILFDDYCKAIIENGINDPYIRAADWKEAGAGLAIILNTKFIQKIKKETGLEYIDTRLSEYFQLTESEKNQFAITIANRKTTGLNCNSNNILLNVIKKCKEKN